MHLIASDGSFKIKGTSVSSIRQFPMISTPSSTVFKLRSEVKTQLLLPFRLSLLPTTKFLFPLIVFSQPIITLLYWSTSFLIWARQPITVWHLLQSQFLMLLPPNVLNSHFGIGLLKVNTDLSLFRLKMDWKKEPKSFLPPKRPPRLNMPPNGKICLLLLLSEQSKSAMSAALRALMALVVESESALSLMIPAKQSALVVVKRVKSKIRASAAFILLLQFILKVMFYQQKFIGLKMFYYFCNFSQLFYQKVYFSCTIHSANMIQFKVIKGLTSQRHFLMHKI